MNEQQLSRQATTPHRKRGAQYIEKTIPLVQAPARVPMLLHNNNRLHNKSVRVLTKRQCLQNLYYKLSGKKNIKFLFAWQIISLFLLTSFKKTKTFLPNFVTEGTSFKKHNHKKIAFPLNLIFYHLHKELTQRGFCLHILLNDFLL